MFMHSFHQNKNKEISKQIRRETNFRARILLLMLSDKTDNPFTIRVPKWNCSHNSYVCFLRITFRAKINQYFFPILLDYSTSDIMTFIVYYFYKKIFIFTVWVHLYRIVNRPTLILVVIQNFYIKHICTLLWGWHKTNG